MDERIFLNRLPIGMRLQYSRIKQRGERIWIAVTLFGVAFGVVVGMLVGRELL